ncbi:MAG: hypothetical protein RM368_14055 [Nostoc sp. DedSLP03]|uniref:hypothetical protein n=1 Tax=Nostoc sp. DedSLP03 TaxID=3075400 RepID=UPI002AD30BAA|nr:hypothetical protein [Nostoc sp. DedSLP03]MDZ7966082.1 hypothetical protein [Nostoc sp. DedSLP03]
MANITIYQLKITGSELFQDTESFLDFLKDEELDLTIGGGTATTSWTVTSFIPTLEVTTITTVTTAY